MSSAAMPLPWVLSAADEPSLRERAAALSAHLAARPELEAADVGWSLVGGHAHAPRRAVAVGADRAALVAGLDAIASGVPARGVARGDAGTNPHPPTLVFVFPGQGSQWPGMALALAAESPLFADSLRACEAALSPHIDWKLDDVLRAAPDDPLWDRSDIVQPSLFCVMVSLAALWRSFGVRPDAVVGHSLGEISAARVAGILSLDDAARVAALTSRALHELGGDDGMVLVDLGAGELEQRIARIDGRLTLAAFNGPHAIVVAGEQPALDELLRGCEADAIRARRIRVDGTSSVAHSSQIEAIRERLARDLAPVTPRPSGVTFYSSVTGEPIDYTELGPEYWYRSLRQPVRFQQAMSSLVRDGATMFVESSPHPVLTFAVEGTIEDAAEDRHIPVIGSLRRDGGLARFLTSVGEAHSSGIAVDWTSAFATARPHRVELPAADERAPVAPEAASAPADSLLPASRRTEAALLALVREHAAAVLGFDGPDAVTPRRAFRELGMTSLQAVELRNRLALVTGLRLASTLVYDHPTPAAVAARLGAILSGAGDAARATVRASAHHDEPIAIVGMGCRYPGGVHSAGDLWDLVESGTDAIGPFPTDRGWDLDGLYDADPDAVGKSYVRSGGFLYDAPDFDAAFFTIAPREAAVMDPQQRLVLETAWSALEDAAIDPERLAGSPTGVFLGVSSQDYGSFLPGFATEYEGLRMTGSLTSVVSGRISYALGLQGPGVTVDTACSSSLVALHLACQALCSGECSLALAGGVTVLSSPGMFVEFSRQRGLAPDGRSKPFAAGADGASWAEGAGVLVVERLSDARRNGHRVLGLVRGTATNQDGASNGLSAPNGPSQEQVIRQALANAGLRPGEVDAVEAHGTGTTLGDPIEAGALLATYGQDRARGPLRLGSIKSNIGHSHAAAGVAGVIKMLMAMRAGVLPRTLHVDAPSPHVDWSAGEIALLTEAVDWPRAEQPRRAGVSGFGISGTNAHVVLEEAPVEDRADADAGAPPAVPWVLSAKSEPALRAQARRLREHLAANPELAAADVGWSLAVGRAGLAHRAAIVGADRAALLAGLDAVASAMPADGVATGAARDAAKVAFVFCGQGSQWLGMALDLWDGAGVFGASMRACADALRPHTSWELRDVIAGAPGAPALERMDVVQPASFAVFVSLAALWRSYGVEPAVVVGHSPGEIAAAHVAGALSLDDAARVVALRSAALVELAGAGGMLSVFLPAGDVLERIGRFGGRISLASYNSPRSSVVAGEPAALRELLEECEADGARARMIAVDYASHSAQIESIRERLLKDLGPIAPVSAAIPIFSTTTAALIDGARLDAEHWYRNLREPVRFEQATRALVDDGVTAFIESSPHPVLTWAVQETVDEAAADPDQVAVVGSLRRDEGTLHRFLSSAGEAFARGVPVDWEVAFAGSKPRRVGLPTYPFQRTRFWFEQRAGAAGGAASLAAAGVGAAEHPLLGAAVALAGGGCLLSGRLALSTHPWLADHELFGAVTLAQTAFAELALRAGDEVGCDAIDELTLAAPLVLPAQGGVLLQVTVGAPDDGGQRALEVHARPDDGRDAAWVCHATGTLSAAAAGDEHEPLPEAWPPPGAEALDIDELYDRLAADGRTYGAAFQTLRAWRLGDSLFSEVALSEEQAADGARFVIHPALLDAALHPAIAQREAAGVPLALHWTGLRVAQRGALALHVRIAPVAGDNVLALTATDERGAPALSVDAIAMTPLPDGARTARRDSALEALYRVRWTPLAATAAGAARGAADVVAPRTAAEALELLRGWLATERPRDARLAVLVPGASAVRDGESPDPDAAAVRGLVRSAQSEHPGRFVTIDADTTEGIDAAIASGEAEVAVRGGELLVRRLARAPGDAPPSGTWRLAPERAGALVGAAPDHGDGDRPLRRGEIRLEVRAAGVNHRDVLIAIGVHGAQLGGEAAGVVAEIGPGVIGMNVGDRVMGLVPGAFGPLAVTDARAVVAIPAGWSFAQAATVPVAHATADEAAGIDDDLFALEPERLGEVLRAALDGAQPLAFRAWDVRDGSLALQHMSRPGHTGKVVLTVPHALDPDGTVLVTGGTGGLGAVVAEHLVREHGARRLLLVSRRGPEAPGVHELIERLARHGATTTAAACDVGDRADLADLLTSIDPAAPLTAVVHAAGTLDNGMIESLDEARVDGVMRPKADAARWLDELTRGEDLAAFVLFSSVAATFNHPGQGNYAAANAYLDALAQRRRAAGLPASAVAWGLWGTGSGMSTRLSKEDIEVLAADTGQRELPVRQALALLDVAIGHREPLLVATTLDLPALRAQARSGVLPALLSDLVRAGGRGRLRAGTRATGPAGSLTQRLAATASAEERHELVLELVRAQAAAVLGHSSSADVPPDRPFKELGFDSLGSVVLRNRLTQITALRLPSTLVFDHPTPLAMAIFMRELAEQDAPDELDDSPLPAPVPSTNGQGPHAALPLAPPSRDVLDDVSPTADRGYRGAVLSTAADAVRTMRFRAWVLATRARLARLHCSLTVETDGTPRFDDLPRVVTDAVGEGGGSLTIRIGRDCRLGRELTLDLWTHAHSVLEIGDRCQLQNRIRLQPWGGAIRLGKQVRVRDGAELKSKGELIVGDDSFIGRNTAVHCHERIELADHVNLAEGVNVMDSDHTHDGSDTYVARQKIVSSPVIVHSNVFVGTNALILRGSHVGRNVMIATGAVLTGGDYPERYLLAGAPAQPLRPLAPDEPIPS
jgi:acyl transferase domain-containing protein/acetyltransferase-like isoleucine patch superfamily enzyme